MRELRVIVADDHAPMRAAVRSVLAGIDSVSLAGEATTAHEALDLMRAQRPDVALVDIRLPGMTGMQLADKAWADAPDTAIVLLAMPAEATFGPKLPGGIAGLVSKELAATEIPEALQAVAAGRRYLSPSLAGGRADGVPATGADAEGAAWMDD